MAVSDHSPEAVEQRAADLQRSREIASSIDHGELFRAAMADPTPEPQPSPPQPPPPQQPQPTPEQQPPPVQATPQERLRDEHGRFLPSTPTEQAPVAAPAAAIQQQPPAQPATPEDAMIPSWRLREERERREEIAQQLAQERQARLMWEQQMLQTRQAQEQQPVPDMVTDPAGYHAHMQRTFQEALRNHEANVSFRLQHMIHGEEFMTVYNDMLGRAHRGDPSMVREVMASPDPGARMMELHRETRNKSMLGQHDPVTWASQVWLPQVIKDPQARAQVAQMLQAVAAPAAAPPQANGQASQATYQVPPSLSRVPGAPANGTGGDMSDASLFAFAMRGGR